MKARYPRHSINAIPERLLVNKTELIEHIAKHADISKDAATRALESMIGAVKTSRPLKPSRRP